MNKTIKIIILAFMAIILTGIMVILIENKDANYLNIFNYKSELILEKEYKIDDFNSFNITSDSSDITIKKSDLDSVSIKVYGDKKDEARANIKDNALYIDNDNSSTICFLFCFMNSKIEISVPKAEYDNLKIKIASGDIDTKDITFKDINISSKSGDIKINKALKADLNLVSGDIEFNELDEAKLATISGNIEGNIANKITAKTISGDIRITNIKKSCELSTTSGNISISNLNITDNSILKTISGDIIVDKSNDVYFDTETMSGDINVDENNRFSEIEVKASTTSGNINISK